MRTVAPRVVQQVDVREVPLSIQEHRSHPGWCPHCQKVAVHGPEHFVQ